MLQSTIFSKMSMRNKAETSQNAYFSILRNRNTDWSHSSLTMTAKSTAIKTAINRFSPVSSTLGCEILCSNALCNHLKESIKSEIKHTY